MLDRRSIVISRGSAGAATLLGRPDPGRDFFELLELARPERKTVAVLVARGMYGTAMDAFRDQFLRKLA